MVALKGPQIDAFLKAPDKRTTAVLVYGADAGLVSERAQGLARLIAEQGDPPGEVLRLDESDLEQDPERIDIELLTVPMFGGRKIVRVSAGRRVNAQSLKSLLERASIPGFLIVEAGNLRPDEGLRPLFERAPAAAALPCFADEVRDIEGLISDIVRAAGLAITPEARAALASRLGADRALTRSEIDKVVLYAGAKGTIDADDVEAIAGDASELTIDRVVHLAAAARSDKALLELDRCVSAGESPQSIIAALQRHFLRLHRVRASLDAGRSMEEAVRGLRPPLHFRARDAMIAECRTWTGARLADALARIGAAAKAARLGGRLEALHAERLILEICRLATAAQRPR